MTTAYLVVPCYNEEAVLPETVKRLTEKLRGLIASGRAGECLFVSVFVRRIRYCST